jgi:hypothetical protein
MSSVVKCSNCGSELHASGHATGTNVKCQCGQAFTVPIFGKPVDRSDSIPASQPKSTKCSTGQTAAAEGINAVQPRPLPTQSSVSVQSQKSSIVSVSACQILAWVGAVLLAIGVFMPSISIPIVGAMNYFQIAKVEAVFLLIMATITAWLACAKIYTWVTGIGSLAIVVYSYAAIQANLSNLRLNMSTEPFGFLCDVVQTQWGWVLLTTAASLILAAIIRAELLRSPEQSGPSLLTGSSALIMCLVVAGYTGWELNRSSIALPEPFLGRSIDLPRSQERAEDPVEWFDASEYAQRQGDISVRVTKVILGNVEGKGGFRNESRRSEEKLLQIQLSIENLSSTKIANVTGWSYHPFLGHGREAELVDNFGNTYRLSRFSEFDMRPDGQIAVTADIYPGKSTSDVVVFNPPVEGIQYLRLSLPADKFGSYGRIGFQIPASMIEKSP